MEMLREWLSPSVIWFVLGLIAILLELMNPGVVVIFFGIGAWVVTLVCLLMDISLMAQLLIFLICSVASLLLLRRWFKRLFHGRLFSESDENEILDEYFGKKATVTQQIPAGGKGKIEFRGTYWDAESYEEVKEGDTVEIIDKKNITFTVKPV